MDNKNFYFYFNKLTNYGSYTDIADTIKGLEKHIDEIEYNDKMIQECIEHLLYIYSSGTEEIQLNDIKFFAKKCSNLNFKTHDIHNKHILWSIIDICLFRPVEGLELFKWFIENGADITLTNTLQDHINTMPKNWYGNGIVEYINKIFEKVKK